jgi:hypothetical protein
MCDLKRQNRMHATTTELVIICKNLQNAYTNSILILQNYSFKANENKKSTNFFIYKTKSQLEDLLVFENINSVI